MLFEKTREITFAARGFRAILITDWEATMLEISTNKIARIIIRAREKDGKSASDPTLKQYIADMNGDEQASLVAVMWIGRETFGAEELAEVIQTAKAEATAPTENYLLGIPMLPDYLESGLEALGYSVGEVEGDFL